MLMGFLCRICRCFAGGPGEDAPSATPADDPSVEERTETAPEARGKAKGRTRKPAASK